MKVTARWIDEAGVPDRFEGDRDGFMEEFMTAEDVVNWGDCVLSALGTEYAERVTIYEAYLADAISTARNRYNHDYRVEP